jgi:two-component system cell cycle sensor histidine kinase/response regulator CckA
MHDAANPPAPSVAQELTELRRQFIVRLPGQLDAIAQRFHALSNGRWEKSASETLHRMLHSLTGTSGTFRLHDLSLAARQFANHLAPLLGAPMPPGEAAWAVLKTDMVQLSTADRGGPEPEPAPPRTQPCDPLEPSTLVHLVIDSGEQAESLCLALTLDGFRVSVFPSPASFHANAIEPDAEQPSAVVLAMGGSEQSAFSLIEQLGLSGAADRPLVVGIHPIDLPTRIAVGRAGASRSLPLPLDPVRLVRQLNSLTGRAPQQPWRILLVDDEALALQAHAAYLRQAGMDVRTLVDPMQTLEAIESFEPDVLVLDVYMPEVNGPELAAVLRESHVSPHMAIVFLSAETDMTQQLAALDLGGDDFLIKPVQPTHLVAAVTARARRARQNMAVQKHLETTLYERQREHLALDHHAMVGIVDRDGNITYVNEMFCQVTGHQRDHLIDHNVSLLRSGQNPRGFLRGVWETIEQKRAWQGEMRCSRKDSSTYWAKTTITPFLDESGRLYQYVVIQTDISHIKATEATIRRQHDMQRMTNVAAVRLMAAPTSGTGPAIEAALRNSGEQLCADRADLFGFSEDGTHMRNLYSWCSTDKHLSQDKLQQAPIESTPWMREQFMTRDMVVIPDVAALPPKADADRRMLQGHRVRALLVIPLHVNGRLSGFLSYSSARPHPEWTPGHLGLLKVLTEVVGSAIARRRAEQALRDSEARLNFLVSSSPVTIYTCESRPPFAVTYISPNVQQLLGFAPDAFLQDPGFWAELVHPEDQALFFAELPRLLRRGSHRHEYRSRTLDNGYKWLLVELIVVRDDAGEPMEIIGYSTDITERKRIGQELFEFNHELEQRVAEQSQNMIESERISRATLDAMSARVVILDERGVILAANRAWLEFQQSATEGEALIEGVSYLAFCDRMSETVEAAGLSIAAGIRAVIAGDQQAFLHEYTSHLPGEQRWFLCRVETFPGDGAVRVVVSHENITQMKQIERQHMRSQRLESLGTLAGGVAHDLNNSLAPILMGMGILQDQYPEEQKLITMIHNSAKRGADMVRQLLAFAKGVDGQGVDGQRVAVQPGQLVTELDSLMKGSFPKNIALQIQIDAGLPMVLGDATQLHQILLNLCVNARDAMPHGGTLTVEAKVVDIGAADARSDSAAKPGRYVSWRVTDTGDGIAPDVLDRIFDPFFTTKSQEKGTGLGLSTVLGIVKGHAGFVQVHSTAGKGSTFSVYLPALQGDAGGAATAAARQPFRGQGESILFVDDEPVVREVARTVLTRLNFKAIVAIDGEDGLIKVTENRATLKAIITDMHMPHMDGLAFVHAVRRTMPDIPIIMASGRVDDAAAKELRALGVMARLDKPFTEAQLAEKLGALLRQSDEPA